MPKSSEVAYSVACSQLYSKDEHEQSQRESNTQVEVNKVVEFSKQIFSVEIVRTCTT